MSSLDDIRARLHRPDPDHTMRTILKDQGDDGVKPRLVHHVAYFNTEEDKSRFTAAIKEAGYEIDKSPESDAVAFSMVTPVSGEAFESAVQFLKQKAGECDGQYDGWGCSVVLD